MTHRRLQAVGPEMTAAALREHIRATDDAETSRLIEAGDWEKLAIHLEGIDASPEAQATARAGVRSTRVTKADAALVTALQLLREVKAVRRHNNMPEAWEEHIRKCDFHARRALDHVRVLEQMGYSVKRIRGPLESISKYERRLTLRGRTNVLGRKRRLRSAHRHLHALFYQG